MVLLLLKNLGHLTRMSSPCEDRSRLRSRRRRNHHSRLAVSFCRSIRLGAAGWLRQLFHRPPGMFLACLLLHIPGSRAITIQETRHGRRKARSTARHTSGTPWRRGGQAEVRTQVLLADREEGRRGGEAGEGARVLCADRQEGR